MRPTEPNHCNGYFLGISRAPDGGGLIAVSSRRTLNVAYADPGANQSVKGIFIAFERTKRGNLGGEVNRYLLNSTEHVTQCDMDTGKHGMKLANAVLRT